jgi:hypothetical protein
MEVWPISPNVFPQDARSCSLDVFLGEANIVKLPQNSINCKISLFSFLEFS